MWRSATEGGTCHAPTPVTRSASAGLRVNRYCGSSGSVSQNVEGGGNDSCIAGRGFPNYSSSILESNGHEPQVQLSTKAQTTACLMSRSACCYAFSLRKPALVHRDIGVVRCARS